MGIHQFIICREMEEQDESSKKRETENDMSWIPAKRSLSEMIINELPDIQQLL
jgi:hypothetical protein